MKKWWDKLAGHKSEKFMNSKKMNKPDPQSDCLCCPLTKDEIQSIKDKKEINQQEAFDLLYYDKVSQDDFFFLKNTVEALRIRVEKLEPKSDVAD